MQKKRPKSTTKNNTATTTKKGERKRRKERKTKQTNNNEKKKKKKKLFYIFFLSPVSRPHSTSLSIPMSPSSFPHSLLIADMSERMCANAISIMISIQSKHVYSLHLCHLLSCACVGVSCVPCCLPFSLFVGCLGKLRYCV